MTLRQGQWVKTTRLIVFGTQEEPAGTVGIHRGPAMIAQPDGPPAAHPTLREVHLVHSSGGVSTESRQRDGVMVLMDTPFKGGDTRKVVAIEAADLQAVVDRNDIPADRLATYDPAWQPQP